MLLISHAQVCNHGTQVYHVIVCVLYLSKMCVISQISVFCHTCWCYHICHRCMAWMRSVLCRISLCYIIDCMFYVRTHARACTPRTHARTRMHTHTHEEPRRQYYKMCYFSFKTCSKQGNKTYVCQYLLTLSARK